jgi:hypothetical protein
VKPLPWFRFRDTTGNEWQVILSTTRLTADLLHEGSPLCGCTNRLFKLIHINAAFPDPDLRSTLLHEIMHVVIEAFVDGDMEENLARLIEDRLKTILETGGFKFPPMPRGLAKLRTLACEELT